MMDPEEHDRLRAIYHTFTDEALLDMLKSQWRDFSPEALDLMRAELRSRGRSSEDLRADEVQPSDDVTMTAAQLWVTIARCPDSLVAKQAVDILAQQGIVAAEVEDSKWSQAILGVRSAMGTAVSIAVSGPDAVNAREILSTFPPLAEAGDGSSPGDSY